MPYRVHLYQVRSLYISLGILSLVIANETVMSSVFCSGLLVLGSKAWILLMRVNLESV